MSKPESKIVSLVKVCISMALTLLMVIFSFTSIFTIDTQDENLESSITAEIVVLLAEVSGVNGVEVPEEISVTPVSVVATITTVIKYVELASSDVNNPDAAVSNAEKQKYAEDLESFNDLLETESGSQSFVIFAMILSIMDFNAIENISSNNILGVLAMIMLICIRIAIMLYIMLFVLLFAIFMVISFLSHLIKVIKNRGNLSIAANKICGKKICLLAVVCVMLGACIFDGVELGIGMIALFIIPFIEIIVMAVLVRLRKYSSADTKYVNIVQGTALLGTAGCLCFTIGALNTGIFKTFVSSFKTYLAELAINGEVINQLLSLNKQSSLSAPLYGNTACLIDILLIVVAALGTLSVCTQLVTKFPGRIALSDGKKGSGMGSGILALIIAILPIVTSKLSNAIFYDVIYNSDTQLLEVAELSSESILTLSSGAMAALIVMIVGAILIIASSILYKVLEKNLCKNMSVLHEQSILVGEVPESHVENSADAQSTENE